ncbi:MAG: 4-(cytidine 5'-diphospho)-2-C-methyl-D-erythritol kinase [Bryobacterales bacterium]|nr:4-(cytidine 5'-diphospho)-2-C-methyl-D-erythritol kinase [Bryobacterales bacterium]MDE0620048.1 4-(cytidine 5'-diphospho)-2-C-methyl-D-erythritol kinase [Bryobacterales bacterium]
MVDPTGLRPQALRLRAYAKVNLFLRVLGKRPDGFHDIRTLFQTVSLSDSLGVRLTPGGQPAVKLTCSREDLQGEDNLAWRAADLMLRRTGLAAQIEITLDKAIPSGAGLGGGSSDAAAVIRAVASMLPARPGAQALLEVAAELGSDVPFFLLGGSAIGTGRGTELKPLSDLRPTALAIAQPGVEVSTAWAYRALEEHRAALTPDSDTGKIEGSDLSCNTPSGGPLPGSSDGMVNDFESVVFRRYPLIAALKERLQALGAQPALMSGSGSAVFGVFESYQSARLVARTLRAEGFAAWPAEYVDRAASRVPGTPDFDSARA